MEFLRANLPLLLGTMVLAGLWLFLRTPATQLASASSLDGLLGQGEPIVLDFFGNT